MLSIVFWLVSLAVVEARLDSDHYHTRQQAERDCQVLWFMDPRSVDRIVSSTQSAEVSQRAARARRGAISRYLGGLGEPPWCDWLLYNPRQHTWTNYRIEETIEGEVFVVKMWPDFEAWLHRGLSFVEDRYQSDYLRYRLLQREWSREYLERGGYRWVVELDWFFGRMVERDYWDAKGQQQLPSQPIKWW